MQKHQSPGNWLIILLCIFLVGLTISSANILLNTNLYEEISDEKVTQNPGLMSIALDPETRQKTLIVGGDDSNPPYSFLQNGQALGLDNDLMREVGKNLGMQVEFRLSPLSEVQKNLQNGVVDVIGGMVRNDESNEDFLYGIPHAVLYYDLFVRRGSAIQSISDIENKAVLVQSGDTIVNYLTEQGYSSSIVFTETPLEAMTLLASSTYDGVLTSRIKGYYLIRKYHLGNLKGIGESLEESDYGFAVSRNNRNLLLKINQAMATIEASGTYEDLSGKWLSTYQQAGFFDKNETIIYGLVILLAIIFVIVAWGWSLRRLVKRRTSELHASEKKYRQLINCATEGVLIVENLTIAYINPFAASIIGYKDKVPEEKLSLLDYIHPLDHELILTKYHQLMENLPVNTQLSFRILTVDGFTRWIKSNAVKIEWEKKPALLSFFSDITDERRMEESVKSSEENYRLIFTQSPVGLFYYDSDLRITRVNDRFSEIMGETPEKLENYDLNSIEETRIIDVLKSVITQKNGYFEGKIKPFVSDERSELFVKLRTAPILNQKMEIHGGIGLLEDITEQITSEHKIQNLEDIYAKTFYTSTDAINITKFRDGTFVDINRGFTELTGYTREEVIGRTFGDIDLWRNAEDRVRLIKGLKKNGEVKNQEINFRCKNGEIRTGLLSASIVKIDGDACILAITRDINSIKKAEELIQNSEIRYRSIFESVPVSIWEQDLLEVYDRLEELRKSGVVNLQEYLDEHAEFVYAAIKSVKILDVNEAGLKIYRAKSKEQLIRSWEILFNDESLANFKQKLISIWNREAFFSGDTVNVDLNGERILINLAMKIPEKREGFKNVLVIITDITQRKQAEEALLESESRYRQLVEQVNVVVYLNYAGFPSRTKYISPQVESLFGYKQDVWFTDPELLYKIVHPDDLQNLKEINMESEKTGKPYVAEYRAYTRDGRMVWIHDEAVLVCDADRKPDDWHGVIYDITARKTAEEALRESENRYRTIFNSVPVSIKEEDFSTAYRMLEEVRQKGIVDFEEYLNSHHEWVTTVAKNVRITEVNQESMRIFEADSKEQLLQTVDHFFVEESYSNFRKVLLAIWNHQPYYEQETVNKTLSGEIINVLVSIAIPSNADDFNRVLVTIMDISERKQAEEQIRTQVRYLAALRAVDMAISASMDLPITLRVLLNQVHQQLMVDAVSILTLDTYTQTLRYSAGIGFQTNAIEQTNLRLGQGYAGQAALERRIITVEDLAADSALIQARDFDDEGFIQYIGVPLVSKGTVKGVLELFNRSPFKQDSAWIGLLESMAGQAAIAIENATLMDEVQRVNVNLRSAYDATIEGWARSIDLRSGDSETHAKQVADLTIELAQTAGFQGEGLMNLRRGALLHDIGKLGVPDSILLKSGPLTDDEWVVMKTHPVIARNLLMSIDFLQSSIEIPYSHHERWDGSGYPEGLSGEQIPFSARVFAVVDCWDSLRSDRPWRKAWTDGNAWEYIENNTGKAFDPQIVEKFRQLLGHGFAAYF